jgi:hypothetical protein
MLISVEATGENWLQPGQDSMGDAPVLSHCSVLRHPWPKPTGVLEHWREGETNCWFSILVAFPSDRIPKATNDVNEHYFIHSSNSYKLYQRIPGTFWSY